MQTYFYLVLLSITGFHLSFIRCYAVHLSFTGFYWVLQGFTGFYKVLLGFTGFYWVLLGFTELKWLFHGRWQELMVVPARPRPLANLWVASVVLFFYFSLLPLAFSFLFFWVAFHFVAVSSYSLLFFFVVSFPIHWLSAPPVRLDRPLSVARDAGRHDVTA